VATRAAYIPVCTPNPLRETTASPYVPHHPSYPYAPQYSNTYSIPYSTPYASKAINYATQPATKSKIQTPPAEIPKTSSRDWMVFYTEADGDPRTVVVVGEHLVECRPQVRLNIEKIPFPDWASKIVSQGGSPECASMLNNRLEKCYAAYSTTPPPSTFAWVDGVAMTVDGALVAVSFTKPTTFHDVLHHCCPSTGSQEYYSRSDSKICGSDEMYAPVTDNYGVVIEPFIGALASHHDAQTCTQ